MASNLPKYLLEPIALRVRVHLNGSDIFIKLMKSVFEEIKLHIHAWFLLDHFVLAD